ncbi:MAG: hypothetical protein ACR2NU_13225 [Aeoliella sp.]
MSQINRPPLGLQELLGSQNFGDNPSQLAQSVVPTIDLFPFLATSTLKIEGTSGGQTGEGELMRQALPGRAAIVSLMAWMTNGLIVGPEDIGFFFGLHGIADESNFPGTEYLVGPSGIETWPQSSQPIWYHEFSPFLFVEPGTEISGNYNFAQLSSAYGVQLRILFYDLSK